MIQFALGFMLGLVVDAIWWNSNVNKYEKKFFSVLEHFHWALISLIAYTQIHQTFLVGFAIALLTAEWSEPFQYDIKHPFSFGSDHFGKSALIGAALVAMLIVLLLIQALP